MLSNYLMFLLVVKPEMLPNPRPQEAHAGVCRVLDNIWSSRQHGDSEGNSSAASSHKNWNPFHMLKEQFQRLNELFHQDGPNASSRIKQRKELFSNMWNRGYDEKVCVPSFNLFLFCLFLSHCTDFCQFQFNGIDADHVSVCNIYRTTYFIS